MASPSGALPPQNEGIKRPNAGLTLPCARPKLVSASDTANRDFGPRILLWRADCSRSRAAPTGVTA